MSKLNTRIFDTLIEVTNEVRETNFTAESVDYDSYLGGELGIDSREMLEIWYEVEKKLEVEVNDYEKRDIYTVQDVIDIFERKMTLAENAQTIQKHA